MSVEKCESVKDRGNVSVCVYGSEHEDSESKRGEVSPLPPPAAEQLGLREIGMNRVYLWKSAYEV